MAMEGGGALKMQVRNKLIDFDKKFATEFNYALKDESDSEDSDEDMIKDKEEEKKNEEAPDMINLTVQSVFPS